MVRLWAALVVALVLILGTPAPTAQAPALRPIMREKLANTQQLLEGVVTGNLAIIDRYSERLARISDTEVASWQGSALPEYMPRASAFVAAVQRLRAAAIDGNADAASTAYTELISACVSCHTYVRSSRVARR
jgi:hypothetical protein